MAIVRSDIGHLYLNDVENRSQRNFSSQPPGQSRYFHKPTDAEFAALLGRVAFLTIQGSDTAATVDTTIANGTKLNIKTSAAAPYTQVVVTSSATLAKTQIVTELNLAFLNAGLGLVARIAGTNKITIDTTAKGTTAYVSISASSPSTAALHTVLGLAATTTTGMSVATLKTAAYPTAITVDVSTATLGALSTFALQTVAAKAATVAAIADFIAPSLIETGPALLSFALGNMSKLTSALFQPGGARIGLPIGVAAAIVANDGVTPFTL
jgi:DNA-binding phage protein